MVTQGGWSMPWGPGGDGRRVSNAGVPFLPPFGPHFAMLWVTSAILPTGSLSQREFEEPLGFLPATEVVSMFFVF